MHFESRAATASFSALLRASLISAAVAWGAAAAMAQETIKVGFIGPLSGGNAQQGLSARNGFQLAIDQANAAGLPFRIEPVILDDAANPQTGVAAALKLTNDPQVVAATGHWNSGVALATIPVFQRAGVPFIVWGAISPKITERNNPMVSRVVTTLVNTNEPLAKWAAENIGKKIAIVSDTSDYGVVVTEAGLVRQQMVELGMSVPMIGVDGFHDAAFIKIAGPAAEGTISGIVKEKGNPQLEKLAKDYKAANFAEPSTTYTKNAFDAANIIIAAIKKAGTKDKTALAKAIREIEHDGAMGHTSFDENGQTKLPVELELRTVKNGSWTTR
jgi:branched-chain amino acid transport system substrate-binding protein